jgi:outer membrane receptor protein involved in Fe transport
MPTTRIYLNLFFCTLQATAVLSAQQTTGTIRGTVTDASGGAVTSASVTATNGDTGVAETMLTDVSGWYSFPLLRSGYYTVKAEAKGFNAAVQRDVLVRITETAVVNFGLQVGSVSESVTVTGVVSLVQTDTSSEGKVIEKQTISSLPLATRNFTQLLGLTAGVLTNPYNAESIGFGSQNPNVNGMRAGSNNYLLDGAVNNNPMNNAVEGVGTPSVAFLQEFKVITNMYSAEYGRNSGSVVNVVTRTGTNSPHGEVFEFVRNNVFVARPFFAQRRGQNTQNQFGATLGGPVVIPKVYKGRDRTFFFFGYEGLRQRNTNSNDATVIGRVPLATERQGVFATTVRDPLTGQPFPGNAVPVSRIHSTSAQLLEKYVPLPNANDPLNNFIQQFGTPFNANQFTYRIDHTLGDKDRVMFRQFNEYANQSTASGRLPGFARVQTFTQRHLALSEIHTVRPNIINEFRFGYYNHINPANDIDGQDLGYTGPNVIDPRTVGITPMNDVLGLPGISVTGLLGYGYTGNDYKDQIAHFVFNDTLSHVLGRHTLKYGTEIRYGQEQSAGVPWQGRFAFNGQYTGVPLADFLLGGPNSVTIANGPAKIDMRDWNYNFFAQDDWKVSKRLTLNFGVRYEYNRPLTETKLGQLLNFYPERYRGPGTDSGLVIGGLTPGVPAATVYGDRNNFAPRLGFAYSFGTQTRTVVRGGYGIFYDTPTGQVTQQKLFEPPYSANQTVLFGPTSPLNGFNFPQPIDLSNPPPKTVPGGSLAIRPIAEHHITGYAQQWNFGLQRELSNGLLASVSYVGTRGRQLFRNRNINYPRTVGTALVRPYDGFSSIMLMDAGANSEYHSLQLTAQKRFQKGASLLAAYTYGKAMDEAASTTRFYDNATGDPANLRGSWGPAAFDRTQRLVVSYNLEIPNPFGAGAKGAAAVLNGWEVSGVTTLQSGLPFSVTNAQSNLDHDGDAGSAGTGGRADAVSGVQAINSGPNSSKLNNYLNPAAFALAPRSRYGTLGRNTLRGPGSNLWDARISKITALRERVKLRFLAEFFNLWNHPAFGNTANTLGTATFGTIRSTVSNARIAQLAIKLEY